MALAARYISDVSDVADGQSSESLEMHVVVSNWPVSSSRENPWTVHAFCAVLTNRATDMNICRSVRQSVCLCLSVCLSVSVCVTELVSK